MVKLYFTIWPEKVWFCAVINQGNGRARTETFFANDVLCLRATCWIGKFIFMFEKIFYTMECCQVLRRELFKRIFAFDVTVVGWCGFFDIECTYFRKLSLVWHLERRRNEVYLARVKQCEFTLCSVQTTHCNLCALGWGTICARRSVQ